MDGPGARPGDIDAPLIINAALTGHVPTREMTPHVPLTPAEIARDAAQVHALGASIVHVHARDPEGRPTHDRTVFGEIVRRIREQCPQLIIVASTSGRDGKSVEDRMQALTLEGDAKPDMASLTLGSINFMKGASINPPEKLRRLLSAILDAGVLPEFEIFDTGMANYTRFLLDHMDLPPRLYANLILGSLGGIPAAPRDLVHLVGMLPAQLTWAGAGVGRFAFRAQRLSLAMGGHVRVGIEDSIYMDPGKQELATNAALVERVRKLADAMQREIATPATVRAMLQLPARE